MRSFSEFKLAIRRRETPFHSKIYDIAKKINQLSVPVIPGLHNFLYNEWAFRTSLWHNLWRVFYYEPMFKSMCKSVGQSFKMYYAGNGITRIGGNLNIYIGSNVSIFDNTMLAGQKILDNPELHIGDNTYIGPRVSINVAKKISIGRYCLITSLIITDNTGHPIDDVISRLGSGGGSPHLDTVRPVTIGDFCFLALDSVVYPGTIVGDGVVARVGTHLNKSVPPFCLVGGNPWRIIRKLSIPEELRGIVGDERFESYLEAHRNINQI